MHRILSAGKAIVDGVNCDVWELKTPGTNLTLYATATQPVRWVIETYTYPPRQTMDFGPISEEMPPWSMPDTCLRHPICPDGKPTLIDVRFEVASCNKN
jgi:hypothetical protein